MRASIIAASLLAAVAQAISVTAPTKGQVVDLAAGFEVKFDRVSSDPTSAHLFIVNMAGGGEPFSKDLGEVDLTEGSVVVTDDTVPNGIGYQFNVQSVSAHNTGILAQSQQFEVKSTKKDDDEDGEDGDDKSTTAAPTASKSAGITSSASAPVSSQTTLAISATRVAANASSTVTSPSASVSTAAAAPASVAQKGSILALAVGIMAVIA